jgi:hypothetical protein
MKKLGFLLFLVLMLGIASGSALAQNVGDNSVYFTTYFANNLSAAAVPDATVRIVNDGTQVSATSDGSLWASIYVFDDSQELTQCCSCFVSADGLLSESVKNQLTARPLTHIQPSRGVIKLISSAVNAGGPKNDYSTTNFTNTPAVGLRAWATHIQSVANRNPNGPAPYSQTETSFADSNLNADEKLMLEQLCRFDYLLSGYPCRCTPEDLDF